MKILVRFFLILLCVSGALAQAPTVEKIDPPSWWTGSTINPVRVLVRGTGLTGAKVESTVSGLTPSNIKVSANGHYVFFDLAIKKNLRPGDYQLKIITPTGAANADFNIFAAQPRESNYSGYSADDVIYLLMPDRFDDGDPSNDDPPKSKGLYDRSKPRSYHGGDLQGIIDRLPYLKSLGVTAIWTTPIYDNNDKPDTKEVYGGETYTTGYHGYGAVDFYAVDEHFGDLAKLKEFVRKAHQSGFVVIQDQVANHTGPYHVWANDPPTPTWFNGTLADHISNNWQKWTTMDPRATYQMQRSNLDGWFLGILPDLNQNDPEVERYLTQNSLWWIAQTGMDAIRMDTLPHVPRSFWAKWSAAIHREYPKVNILGELYDGDPALVAYFQKGRKGNDGIDTGIDTLFDYALYYPIIDAFAKGQPIRSVSQMLAHDWLYPKPSVLTTFLGIHDKPRFMSEPGATIDGLKLAQTFLMTTRGTPIIYYGDEIAMRGGDDPDNRKDFPGGFPADGIDKFAAAGRTREENDIWNYTAKLAALRKQLEPLRRGDTLDLLEEEQQIAYARLGVTRQTPVIVAINNDTKPAELVFQVTPDTECKFTNDDREKFIETYWWREPDDIKRLWLWPGNVMTDRLGTVGDVRIDCGVMRFTLPARTAAIFTTK